MDSDVETMEELDEEAPGCSRDSCRAPPAARAARPAARHTAAAAQKRNLRARGPLTAGLGAHGSMRSQQLAAGGGHAVCGSEHDSDTEDDDVDVKQLQRCKELYAKLPKNSKYAQFKLRTLNKAMQLLAIQRQQRNDEQNAQLLSLFRKLGIK